ncbi:hypothetical protein ABL849_32145 (plasmid) [Variovorax sp. 375MFSha3.1]|uniref:hypothetical protein n=1 Tax=unclassified Variovorax TaxID=663243 RepID=UPI003AAF7F28
MKKKARGLIGICMATAAVAAAAGPFGLNAGDTVETVGKVAQLKPTEQQGVYTVSRLPNGHPDLDSYRLIFGPATGLCRIAAWTPAAQSSAYGDEIRRDFRSWQEALTAKYGAPEKFDYLRSGSIWNEPKDWTMSLAKKERKLVAFWTPTPPVDQVSRIAVEAIATSSGRYSINLEYEFDNFDACSASLKSKKNANL